MTTRLPVLISIPHGGDQVPVELAARTCLGPAEILHDGDAFTRRIYDLEDRVRQQVSAEVARAFVDLNRAEDDRPPKNPDGVVKRVTIFGQPVYLPGQEPDGALTELLLERYHRPYHRRLRQVLDGGEVVLALDCHSMEAVGPAVSPDVGQRRPAVCLGDLRGQTCPPELMQALQDSFCEVFELPPDEVALNRPFSGGQILRTYGGGAVPWVQVELSRELYLRPPWYDHRTSVIDPQRLRQLNGMMARVLHHLFDDLDGLAL